MDWRVGLGKLAGKLGVDPEEAVARAEQLAKGARTLANDVAEQAAPIAKDVVARLQSAAQVVAAEVADRIEKASQPSPPPDAGTDTLVETIKVPRGSTPAAPGPAAATPAAKPHAVQANASAAFDLAGLSVTRDDARELERIPEGMHHAALDNVRGGAPVSTELAEEIRTYVAGTPQTIFGADDRIRKDASSLAERTGMRHGQLVGVWNGVKQAADLLQRYDQSQGTDFAASAWFSMLGSWRFSEITNDHGDLMRAVGTAIDLASKSSRPYAHAEQLCNLILQAAQDKGWPTALFADAGVLDSFLAVARSAADQPSHREGVVRSLLTLVRAVMVLPVRSAELGLLSMNPHVLRAEFGKAGGAVLETLGCAEGAALRQAAQELNQQDAQVSPEELREIERYPRWLSESAVKSNPQQYAHDTMSEAQALELSAYVSGARGDLGQLRWRLETLWRTPSTCAALAQRFGVEAEPPRNGGHTASLLSDAANVTGNTRDAMLMLLAYDKKHGTQHAVAAARTLLTEISLGETTRDLVGLARAAMGSASATADDKKVFIASIPKLYEAKAWPGVDGRHDVVAMSGLLAGVSDLVKSDPDFARKLFIVMFKVATTPGVSESASPDRRAADLAGRAAVAKTTAEFATSLGLPDAVNFTAIDERLVAQLKSVS